VTRSWPCSSAICPERRSASTRRTSGDKCRGRFQHSGAGCFGGPQHSGAGCFGGPQHSAAKIIFTIDITNNHAQNVKVKKSLN
jgi:hypothetical protein